MIQKEDVLMVAREFEMDVSDERVEEILTDYPTVMEDYPNENWTYIVEEMLYEV